MTRAELQEHFDRTITQEKAEDLLARLAWRGLSGWPLADHAHD